MVTREDVQSFLERLEGGTLEVREVQAGLWVAKLPGEAELVVTFAPPLVLLRVKVMPVPQEPHLRSELFALLLEYNARDLVHGSYGLEHEHIVLTEALGTDDLDFSEFRASVESITLALASHLGALAPYRETR
jgi:hypothetical protein